VLIGVNLLREGLDLPQVSLVAILDADKEGFLRSETALTQTAGRAARNINGLVIMYADTITRSMKRTIDETNRRREKQMEYNRVNGIVPTQVLKKERNVLDRVPAGVGYAEEPEKMNVLQDPVVQNMSKEQLQKAYASAKKEMEKAAAELDFMRAAKFRDEMKYLGELISKK
jgi:excinuclease ABC subunit B